MNKINRQEIYEKYNGHCTYCGCEITIKEMQIDHKNSKFRTRSNNGSIDNSYDNLVPSCRQCNFYKQTFTVEEFRKQLLDTLYPNISKPFQFRLGAKYGMVEMKVWDGVFYFEKLSK